MKSRTALGRSGILPVLTTAALATAVHGAVHVAPDGRDGNPGTMAEPLATLQRAQSLAAPGDTVWVRGGTYRIPADQIARVERNLFACVTFLDKSGAPGRRIHYWAYPGEQPVFDYSEVKPPGRRVVGIWVEGDYIHLKGLEMTGVQVTIRTHTESYCIYSWGNHNIFEQIRMRDNVGTAFRHRRGGGNLVLNCDAYRNHDTVSQEGLGVNVDGFGCHPARGGTGNVFRGCRAWFNSDDGFDLIRSHESVVIDNCWAFYNGYSTSFRSLGDGNGFKSGGYVNDEDSRLPTPIPRHTVRFSLAVNNKAVGFDSNWHLTGNDWYSNSAFANLVNFDMVNRRGRSITGTVDGYDHVLVNNLGYRARQAETANLDRARSTVMHNSFDLAVSLSDADFVSLDESLLTAPRQPDGSLPVIDFMRLAPGSGAIDAGVDVGFPFAGGAPDLGAFESGGAATGLRLDQGETPTEAALQQNHPNPFNVETTIRYSLPAPGHVTVAVYDLLGQRVRTLIDRPQPGGPCEVSWDSTDDRGRPAASGVYLYRVTRREDAGPRSHQRRMVLLR